MAPRQDRTHPLVFSHSATNARLTSTKGGYYSYGGGGCGGLEGGFRGLNDFGIRENMFFDLLSNVNFEPKKKNILNNNNNLLNKRKARFNLAHRAAIQERKHKGSLQERDEIRALEKEAIMYKLKRQAIQVQTRELRRELYKKKSRDPSKETRGKVFKSI